MVSPAKEEAAQVAPSATVGQMPVGLAGILEVTKSGGIGAALVAVFWWMLQTMQEEQGRRFTDIQEQLKQVQTDTRAMQTDLTELKGDLREITVRQLISEEERHRAQPPPK